MLAGGEGGRGKSGVRGGSRGGEEKVGGNPYFSNMRTRVVHQEQFDRRL